MQGLNLCIIDYAHTIGIGNPAHFINWINPEPNPNNLLYFFGLLVALLMQILIIYDYLFNYVVCSQFFIWSRQPQVAYIVNRFSLKHVKDDFIDEYFWNIASVVFILESFLCYINYYYYNKSLLYLSVFIWTISFIESIISITLVNWYIREHEDIRIAIRARDTMLLQMHHDIAKWTPLWRAEEMTKHKDNYNEEILVKRVEEFKTIKINAIAELLKLKDSFLINQLENLDNRSDGTIRDWFGTPTHQNIFNISLYIYYLFICCRDSVYLYNIIFSGILNYPPIIDQDIPTIFWDSCITSLDSETLRIYIFIMEIIPYFIL